MMGDAVRRLFPWGFSVSTTLVTRGAGKSFLLGVDGANAFCIGGGGLEVNTRGQAR